MQWLRLYDTIIDDPKVQRLPFDVRWFYVEILCVANRQKPRGTLPRAVDIAFLLRSTEDEVKEKMKALLDAGLIERGDTTLWRVHGWENRQFKSDDVAARVKTHRDDRTRSASRNVSQERTCNVSRNVTCNAPEQSRSDTEQNTPLNPPTGGVDDDSQEKPKRAKNPPKPDPPEHLPILDLAAERWGVKSGRPVARRLLRTYTTHIVMQAMDALWERAGKEFDPKRLRGMCWAMECGKWETRRDGPARASTIPLPISKPYRPGIDPHPGLRPKREKHESA